MPKKSKNHPAGKPARMGNPPVKPDAGDYQKPKIVITAIVLLLVILSTMYFIITPHQTTTTLDSEIRAAGMKGELDADLSQSGLSYRININRSGQSGGIGGGLIGGGGAELAAFQNISEETTYLKGLNKFQENIGLLLNSYKDKYYTISADTSGTGDITKRTRVNISTHVDLIPFWPTGVSQKYEIHVDLSKLGDAQKVILEEIQVQIWRKLDSDETHFTESKMIWSTKPGSQLDKEGQKKTFTTSISLNEIDDIVGLLTYVKLKIIDASGSEVNPNLISNLAEPDPDNYEIPLSLTINLRVLDSGETSQLAMLLISYPLSIISLILTLVGIFVYLLSLFFKKNHFRKAGYIILAAGILQILATSFLYLGIENLVSVLDGVLKADLRENFQWTNMLSFIAMPGVMLTFGGVLILVTIKRTKKIKKILKAKDDKKGEREQDTFKIISD